MAGRVISGINAVQEALRAGRGVNRIYFAKESRARGAAALLEEARARHILFDFVPQAKLNELTGVQDHQGVAATLSPVAYATLEDCLRECPPRAIALALDQVQHPKNLGMLLRTAVGAGARTVLATARGGALLDEMVLRASAGAAFHIPMVPCPNLPQALRQLRQAQFWVYGLDAHEGEDVFEVGWPPRVALVMGNEAAGMRPGVRKACDLMVRIPLEAELDSLNVAVAAGIALFQVAAAHRRLALENDRTP